MRPINILVAEDNPLNFELLQELLESLGHRIWWARDGQEALSLARTGGFDLLFLDLHMPRLNGLEVMVGLRGDPVRAHLKVIALTADAMPAVRAELLRAGVDGFPSQAPEPGSPGRSDGDGHERRCRSRLDRCLADLSSGRGVDAAEGPGLPDV